MMSLTFFLFFATDRELGASTKGKIVVEGLKDRAIKPQFFSEMVNIPGGLCLLDSSAPPNHSETSNVKNGATPQYPGDPGGERWQWGFYSDL